MDFKLLEIFRGKSTINFKCTNGDIYDSSSRLTDPQGNILNESQYVNTDSTVGYNGGKLSRGNYFAIAGWRPVSYQPEPIRVLKMFLLYEKTIESIKNEDSITEEMFRLPSDIPNPNHKTKEHPEGEAYVDFVQCHPGSESWDWSHACQTWLNYGHAHDFDKLISCIKNGEIIRVKLS